MLGISVGGFAVIAAVLSFALASTSTSSSSDISRSSSGNAVLAAALSTSGSNCSLIVPSNPLSAEGLATPYQLVQTGRGQGSCDESNTREAAFVQATILDPATGAVFVFNPLVINRGSRPAMWPSTPRLPRHAIVGIWFGFNGGSLSLIGHNNSLWSGRCSDGSAYGGSYGRSAYCNAPAFFSAANFMIRTGRMTVPSLGYGRDGAPCLSTRDYGMVDQSQGGGVTSSYLVDRWGHTAQWTTWNSTHMRSVSTMTNYGDNSLLVSFIDPALGCSPWRTWDLSDPGHRTTSIALNELQAAIWQHAPIAFIPLNTPSTWYHRQPSLYRTSMFRSGFDQPWLYKSSNGDPSSYCTSLISLGAWRLNFDRRFFVVAISPVRGVNLLVFLSTRLTFTLSNMHCRQYVSPSLWPTASNWPLTGTASTPSSWPTLTPTMPTGPATMPMAPAPSQSVNKRGDAAPQPSMVAPGT